MKLSFAAVAVVALVALFSVVLANERAQQFAALPRQAGLLSVSDSNFGKFLLAKDRAYHTFLLFTTSGGYHSCDACRELENELNVLSDSYDLLVAQNPSVPQIFFAVASYADNQAVFKSFDLQGVPMLVYFSPTENTPHSKSVLPAAFQHEDHSAETIANAFVKGYTGVVIEVHRSSVPLIIFLVAVFGTIILLLRFALDKVLALINLLLASTKLWMGVCVGIYFIAVAGVLYDIIRGVPFVGADAKGNPVFINTSSGTQFGVEGVIIGALNIGCAICVVVLTKSLRAIGKTGPNGQVVSKEGDLLMPVVGILGFVFLYRAIFHLYRLKNPWYRGGL